MIHAAHPQPWVMQANSNTAAQDGRENRLRFRRHMVLALAHMYAIGGGQQGGTADHVSGPNTASSLSFRVWMVKGFTR